MQTKLLLSLAIGAFLAVSGHAAPTASKAGGKDTKFPSQSSVAAKKPFQTAPTAATKGALDAKDLAGAQKLIGKAVAMQGTVTTVYVPEGNAIVILNFSPDYRDAVSAVVKHQDYALFPDLQTLRGKHLLIHGTLKEYKGRPEIELTDPTQIKRLP